jgi:hypothetical protein
LWERQVFDAYPRGAFETDEEEIAPMYSEAFRRMVGAYPDVLDQMAAVDESGNTPFHLACLLGLKRLVTELFHADSEADMRLNRIGQTGQPPTDSPSLRAAGPGRGMRAAAAMRARTAANHPDHHMQADVTPPACEIGCVRGCARPITRCGRALDAHEARGDRC